jgi:hypothetical protein
MSFSVGTARGANSPGFHTFREGLADVTYIISDIPVRYMYVHWRRWQGSPLTHYTMQHYRSFPVHSCARAPYIVSLFIPPRNTESYDLLWAGAGVTPAQ